MNLVAFMVNRYFRFGMNYLREQAKCDRVRASITAWD